MFFLELRSVPGHVQNTAVAALYLRKSRNGDLLTERWNWDLFRNYEVDKQSLYEHWTLLILLIPAGQESSLQPKLGYGEVVVCHHCSPKPVAIVTSNNCQVNRCHITSFLYTCWTVHFWTCPLPSLSNSYAICWIGWSSWTTAFLLAQYDFSLVLWIWGELFKGARIHCEYSIKGNCWSVQCILSTSRLKLFSGGSN